MDAAEFVAKALGVGRGSFARYRSPASIAAEVNLVPVSTGPQPTSRARTIESLPQAGELILYQCIKGVQDEGSDGGGPALMFPLRNARSPPAASTLHGEVVPPVPPELLLAGRRPGRRFAHDGSHHGQQEALRLSRTRPGRNNGVHAVDDNFLEHVPLVLMEREAGREEALRYKVGDLGNLRRLPTPSEESLRYLRERLVRRPVRRHGLDQGGTGRCGRPG